MWITFKDWVSPTCTKLFCPLKTGWNLSWPLDQAEIQQGLGWSEVASQQWLGFSWAWQVHGGSTSGDVDFVDFGMFKDIVWWLLRATAEFSSCFSSTLVYSDEFLPSMLFLPDISHPENHYWLGGIQHHRVLFPTFALSNHCRFSTWCSQPLLFSNLHFPIFNQPGVVGVSSHSTKLRHVSIGVAANLRLVWCGVDACNGSPSFSLTFLPWTLPPLPFVPTV